MNDIRDIKLPIEIPLFIWILLLLAIAGILAAVAYFLLRRKKIVPPSVITPARSPWEIANERLQELARRHYPESGEFKLFYSGLSDIVRHYLEDQFQIKAPEMTTEEFLNSLKNSSALKPEHKQVLKDFLNGCDMVKFAKYQPDASDAQANFNLAKKLIEETKGGI